MQVDCEDVVALIDEIRRLGSELDDVEAKSAQGGMPERIHRSLSALSNRRGGGVILFGMDEKQQFAVIGVPDVARLQQELASIASEMQPPLRLGFDVCEVEGQTVETVEATRELRGLVETGLVEMHGTRRWAYYTLSDHVPAQVQLPLPLAMSDEEKILAYVREHGSITNAECRELLGLADDERRARYVLGKMVEQKLIRKVGDKRWTRYVL
jgi:predicted HTH transcriptional regulator